MGLRKELRFQMLTAIIFSIINTYITIFINLYIWEKHQQISQVAWFNITMLSFWAIAFIVGGKIFAAYSLRTTMRISSLMAVVAFIFLLTLTDVSPYIWNLCIGGAAGIMCGTYFISQNMFISYYGKGDEFSTYFSVYTFVQQILSIVNPLISATIIKWFGYSVSFVIMFAIVTVLFTLTFYIPDATIPKEDKGKPFFRLHKPWERILELRPFLISCFITGFVLQFQVIFTQLFTFNVSDNKMIIAGLNVLYTVLTMGAYYFVQKTNISAIRRLQLGGALMGVSYLLALNPTPAVLVILNVFSAIGYFFLITNWNANQFSYMSQFKSIALTKVMIGREVILNITRIIMLLFISQVQEFQGLIYQGLIMFVFVCMGLLLLTEHNHPQVQKTETSTGF